jgi:hypothetical protein
MTAEKYLESGMPAMDKSLYDEVRDQASTHTQRGKQGRVLDSARPNRPDSIKDYVKANTRNITVAEFRKFIMKLSRIMKSNDLQIKYEGDKLSKFLEDNPFDVLGEKKDLWDFIYEKLIPFSFVDPNGALVVLPYWNGDIPPYMEVVDGGIPGNVIPNIAFHLISSKKIRYKSSGILVFEKGRNEAGTIYMVVDEVGISLLEPFKELDKIKYRVVPWYDTPVFCSISLPGARVHDIEKDFEYKESFVQPFFEFADEFISTFADNQAVRVQHAYPKTIIDAIACPEQGCVSGYLKGQRNADGKPIKCTNCDANGFVTNIDPYGVLRRPATLGEKSPHPAIEYVFPPIESLRETFIVAFDMLSKGKQAIGLDLIGNETESGVAKKLRLEDFDDMLQALSIQVMNTICSALECAESILEPIETQRKGCEYQIPSSFNIQTASELNAEFNETHLSLRHSVYMSMVEVRTHGNHEAIEAHKIALNAAPVIILTEDELRTRVASGLLSNYDLWLSSNALRIASKLYMEKSIPFSVENDVYTDEFNEIARDEFTKLSQGEG